MVIKKSFASDNYSGVHQRILEKISEVNKGHVAAYGADEITEEAISCLKDIFGDVEVFFVLNGTGANVLALEGMKGRVSAVISPETAHIVQDETGAPSKITGMQLLTVPSIDGKLDLDLTKKWLTFQNNFHKPKAEIISISQTTEYGTVYSLEEIKNISKFAKEHNMLLHMDGARISNAAVALGCTFKEMTGDLGVDVLSFGGTKNGLMIGEALIFFNKELAKDFSWIRKQNLQLYSKMRFMSAQFIPYIKENIWFECASNANNAAQYLKESLEKIGIPITKEVLANAVFAIFPKDIIPKLQQHFHFYIWNETLSEVRLVTSFDSTKEDVDNFIKKIKELLGI
ncbi:threonine aldolase family protein [Cetobacterium sp.]|uniref:threonine aldolase family protein n=1 Tax=Cetobacterium sp. TaxID=2071632 RepID=UPI003AEF9958